MNIGLELETWHPRLVFVSIKHKKKYSITLCFIGKLTWRSKKNFE